MSAKVSKRKSGQRYAELLCDFMFKRMFGSEANKDVLIGFLNMILEDARIVDVDFIPTEHYGLRNVTTHPIAFVRTAQTRS